MKKIEDYLRDLEVKIESYLRKMGVGEKKISFYVEIILKTIAVVAIVVIFFILLQLAVFYGIFAWIGMKISVLTGLDAFLTKGIAFVLMAILFGTPLSSYVWSFLPLPSKNKEKRKERKKKRAIFLIFLAVLSFASYFASKNVYFNPRTGEAEKYYSVGIDGEYVFYSSPGYDPITGDKLLPVDRSVMGNYLTNTQPGDAEQLSQTPSSKVGNGKYEVTFINESNRNLFLFMARNYHPSEPLFSHYEIASGKTETFKLEEGVHFTAFLNSDGFDYALHDRSSVASIPFPDFFIYFKNQVREITEVFMLEVKADNHQGILFTKDNKVHYIDDVHRETRFTLISVGTIILIASFVACAFYFYNRKKLKSYSGKDKEDKKGSQIGEVFVFLAVISFFLAFFYSIFGLLNL